MSERLTKEERDSWRRGCEPREREATWYSDNIIKLLDDLDAADVEIKQLREVVEFYAGNWLYVSTYDCGARARDLAYKRATLEKS